MASAVHALAMDADNTTERDHLFVSFAWEKFGLAECFTDNAASLWGRMAF